MSQVNTVVIVSDKQDFVNQIAQKLVLLRSLDKIKSCSLDEVPNMLGSYSPNILILHCTEDNPQTLSLIKQLKTQKLFKNLPILLINDNCSRETVIEAYDSGITDILFMPIIDYELLIRVIWCLQKNELNLKNESRANFMTTLGIIEPDTGVFVQKYCDEFLKNEISQTRRYSQRACILLISSDKKYPEHKSSKDFIKIIQKSIRLNDSIAIKDEDKFYIYLQKTKLNGAYSVFERINANLGVDAGANAGVVEVQQQNYEDIVEALEIALSKANKNTNSLIVASDFYKKSEQIPLSIESLENPIKTDNEVEYTTTTTPVPVEDTTGYDKNSIKFFNQSYKRKLRVVVEPVFKKYEDLFKTKYQGFAVNSYIGTKSCFSVSSGTVNAVFKLEYDGIERTTIYLTIIDNEQKRLYETETVDFTILDYRKVSLMLSQLIDKFFVFIKGKG